MSGHGPARRPVVAGSGWWSMHRAAILLAVTRDWDRLLATEGRVEFEAARWLWLLILALALVAVTAGLAFAFVPTGSDPGIAKGMGAFYVAIGVAIIWWARRRGLPRPAVVVTPAGIRDARRRHVLAWSGVQFVEVVEMGSAEIPFVVLTLSREEYAALVAGDRWFRRLRGPLDRYLSGRTVKLLPLRGAPAEVLASWLDSRRRAFR